ncbi:type II secretion system protein N [Roseateles microcysteis]|uniref:type II secretion system protein N n=1 Tax=Roseateles microcysteis TaxID=3119057 RepID=UPI002FE5AF2C
MRMNKTASSAPAQGQPRRWAIAGALVGALLALLLFAPASWMAGWLADASEGHLLLTDTRGSIWSGSGVLVLTGGRGSRDATALPGRIDWTLGFKGLGLALRARQECCLNGELQMLVQPGWNRMSISLPNGKPGEWLARFPAAWLGGLGTPWNTLQLGGTVRLSAQDFKLERLQGRWLQSGRLELDLVNLSSRISTLAPLGSYKLSLSSEQPGISKLLLSTMDGALLLNGQGTLGSGKASFHAEATAAPGREAALNNLLNIIGRRQGARSVISIG